MAYIYDLTDTWNAGGTTFNAIKMNVTDSASAAASKLVTLQTNGTEHFSVTKAGVGYFSGNVGIGTASPSSKLTVRDGDIEISTAAAGNTLLSFNGTTANLTVNSSSAPLVFGTSSTERMRITSAGNVGIGTSSPGTKLEVSGNVKLSAAGNYLTFGNPVLPLYLGDGTSLLFGPNNNEQYAVLRGYSGVALSTDGNPALFVNSSGNVGIGTTAPDSNLSVVGPDASSVSKIIAPSARMRFRPYVDATRGSAIEATNTGESAYSILTLTGSSVRITTNLGDVTTFASSGNVGIGTSSPGTKLEVSSSLDEVVRVTSSGSPYISWYAGVSRRGYIQAQAGSFSVASDTAIPLIFATNATERARIDSSGNLLVGTTGTTMPQAGIVMVPALGGQVGYALIGHANGTASGNGYMEFGYNAASIGSITQNGTTGVLYNTSSDARLKHDIVDAPEASSLIDAIKVRSFKWNADNSEQRYGMIAQELLEVAPEAVSKPADPEEMMGVDYSKLVPMLVKEIQSLRARVAQLEGN